MANNGVGSKVAAAINDPTKTSGNGPEQESVIIDRDSLAAIQKGFLKKPSFFGNQQGTQNHTNFLSGLDGIGMFSGFATSLLESITTERDENTTDHTITESEFVKILKRSKQIGEYGNVPEDIVQDFLLMLVSVNTPSTMSKIADAVQIPELANPEIMRNVDEILNVPQLEKIAFMASALSALLAAFGKYPNAAQGGITGTDDISGIIDSLGQLLGGFGNMGGINIGEIVDTPMSPKAIGNFMSELVTGKRIPTNVIAKNPNLQSPSFVGKALFGEDPIPLSNVDIDQIFPKRIGVFQKPSAGGATTTFGITNFQDFSSMMNVESLTSMIMFGKQDVSSSSLKYAEIDRVLTAVTNVTGAGREETVEVSRPDNVIPLMLGLSAGMSRLDKAPFSIDTFRNAWVTSMSASNTLQTVNPALMEGFKKLV